MIVSLWETAFGWLRTRLYAESSQKIDVELGAKLFRHLVSLPLSFFGARRVGDIAMPVRQLETIREFLTNASLSVLVDPFFTVIFLAVMLMYSAKLFLISVLTIPAYVLVAVAVTKPLRGASKRNSSGALQTTRYWLKVLAGSKRSRRVRSSRNGESAGSGSSPDTAPRACVSSISAIAALKRSS